MYKKQVALRYIVMIKVRINFKQLLEDITYTNRMSKRYDVSDIISRNQYYELKDRLIRWLLTHEFTTYTIDGYEYLIGKQGEKCPLVKLTIKYRGTECLLHQNLDSRMRAILGVEKSIPIDTEYVPATYDNLEAFDEEKFREALTRMTVARIRFLRDTEGDGSFWQSYFMNKHSKNPWMPKYLQFLPCRGKHRLK